MLSEKSMYDRVCVRSRNNSLVCHYPRIKQLGHMSHVGWYESFGKEFMTLSGLMLLRCCSCIKQTTECPPSCNQGVSSNSLL